MLGRHKKFIAHWTCVLHDLLLQILGRFIALLSHAGFSRCLGWLEVTIALLFTHPLFTLFLNPCADIRLTLVLHLYIFKTNENSRRRLPLQVSSFPDKNRASCQCLPVQLLNLHPKTKSPLCRAKWLLQASRGWRSAIAVLIRHDDGKAPILQKVWSSVILLAKVEPGVLRDHCVLCWRVRDGALSRLEDIWWQKLGALDQDKWHYRDSMTMKISNFD